MLSGVEAVATSRWSQGMDPSITQAAVLLSLYDSLLTAIALPFLIASAMYCPSSSFSTSDVAH
eukprot:5533697-Ditylum_brightwellii.AAC.1